MKKTSILSSLAAVALCTGLSAQTVFTEDFSAPTTDNTTPSGSGRYVLGNDSSITNADQNITTNVWMHAGNSDLSGGNALVQTPKGTNARAVIIVLDSSLFTAGTTYDITYDITGDLTGSATAGRFWAAELSGYDASEDGILIDVSQGGWATAKPFVATGSDGNAVVNYLTGDTAPAGPNFNGDPVVGENIAGPTTNTFQFTYTAGTDIGFAIGTYNSAFSFDDFAVTTVVPEPSAYALLAGMAALGWVMVRRRG